MRSKWKSKITKAHTALTTLSVRYQVRCSLDESPINRTLFYPDDLFNTSLTSSLFGFTVSRALWNAKCRAQESQTVVLFLFFFPTWFYLQVFLSLLFNSAVLFHQICDGPPLSAYDQEIVCPFFFILSVMLCKWNPHMVSVLFLFR